MMNRKKLAIPTGLAALLFSVSCEAGQYTENGVYAEFHTNQGVFAARLYYTKAPLTVTNFVGLAEGKIENTSRPKGKRYYDGLTFHRVADLGGSTGQVIIQGGCPQGNGRGGPGYNFMDEIHPDLRHDGEGALSMANAGPNTNGSQFFICHKETPHLDGRHAVFGRIVKGMEVVKKIQKGDVIKKLRIVRIGPKAKAFTADQKSFDALKEAARQTKDAADHQRLAAQMETIKKKWPNAHITKSGLRYVVTKKGSGVKPKAGQTVQVHYTGTFVDGREFDSSVRRGQPITFPVGTGQVIRGWDEAILTMQPGEKRVLIIPYSLAYGESGRGPIPPKSTLIFDVHLIQVMKDKTAIPRQ